MSVKDIRPNPFPEKSPLQLARELKEGKIPMERVMEVREYLRLIALR